MENVLSFDVGTASMKCILFNWDFEEIFYANKGSRGKGAKL